MALANWGACSLAGDAVTVVFVYDDVSLIIQRIDYQNLTGRNATVEIIGPAGFNRTFTPLAGTAPTSVNITTSVITMTSTTSPGKGGIVGTWINLPAGWSISSRWPT